MLGALRFWFTKDLVKALGVASLWTSKLTDSEIRQGKTLQTVQLGAWRVLQGWFAERQMLGITLAKTYTLSATGRSQRLAHRWLGLLPPRPNSPRL